MITTKSVGMGAEEANPKPVRHVNWTGQPMKEGDNYWGESEPQPPPPPVQTATPRKDKRMAKKLRRKAERESGSVWTPERRAAFGAKVRAMWQAKRNSAPEVEAQEQGQQNNQQQ